MWSSPFSNSRPEHLLDRAADHVLVAEAGQLARAAAGADQPALLVGDEERGVGRRVVVVEQLEEEAEAAVRAAARALGSRRCARSTCCGCRSWDR